MATPIFVVGKHRSGTTWVANQLCEHPAIAGARHERHHGIHESGFFSMIEGRYGDLRVRSNYIELVEVLAASDYFRIAGVGREFLYSLRPTTHAEVFRASMAAFADRHGADYWLEKSPGHALMLDRLARLFPAARFVAVRRPVDDVVASSLALMGRHRGEGALPAGWRRRALLLRIALSWVRYNACIDAFARRTDRLVRVGYESLRADLPAALGRVCTRLGLDYSPHLARQSYARNTSFSSDPGPRARLTARERAWVRAVAAAARRAPKRVWTALTAAHRAARARRRRPLPDWFFSLQDEPDDAVRMPAERASAGASAGATARAVGGGHA